MDTEQLHRSLKLRHIQLIAFGGVIGTGLFQSIGSTISTAGPGGAVLAYAFVGVMVFFIMGGLGEMATLWPTAGSFETFASHFVHPSFGFAVGWNYWFSWAITVGAEVVGSALLMQYWFPHSPAILWCLLFLALVVGLNLFPVRAYGESEFWLAGLKVVVVLAFLVVGTLLVFGLIGNQPPTYLRNFTVGQAPFVGGAKGFFVVFLLSGYAFQGEEMIGITAGEADNPTVAVHKAIRSIFARIMVFYLGAIVIVACLLPYTDASLEQSPFTMVFSRAGLHMAAGLMNMVIISAVLSCGSSGLYGGSRILYAMALEGKAPALLGHTDSHGTPRRAVLATAAIAALCLASGLLAPASVYLWLIDLSALSGFITWFSISWTHLRFRRGYLHQRRALERLANKVPLHPLGQIITTTVCAVIILGQGYLALDGTRSGVITMITYYLIIPLFALAFLWHRKRTGSRMVPLDAIDYCPPPKELAGTTQPDIAVVSQPNNQPVDAPLTLTR